MIWAFDSSASRGNLWITPALRDAERTSTVYKRIDHVALHVADLERSIAFYERHFGFKNYAQQTVTGGPRIAYLKLGDTVLELTHRSEGAMTGFHLRPTASMRPSRSCKPLVCQSCVHPIPRPQESRARRTGAGSSSAALTGNRSSCADELRHGRHSADLSCL